MAAMDHTFDRFDRQFDRIFAEMREMRRELREEMREMRSELTAAILSLQGRLIQIGFGLVGALVMSLTALVVALV